MEKPVEYITFVKKDRWGIISLNHPPANSLNTSLMDQLNDKLISLQNQEDIRALIITGGGKFFAAGGDISELQTVNTRLKGFHFASHIHAVLNNIDNSCKPIIAAINGPCLGGGLELALACHIRIAGEEARLGMPEIKLGLIPGGGGTQRLPRIVGKAKAYEMILSGDTMDAREALRIGLINSITRPGKCLQDAESYADKLSQYSLTAISYALEVIRTADPENLLLGLEKEANFFGHLCETSGMREGIKAFLQEKKATHP